MADNDWLPTTLGEEVDILTGYPFQSARYTSDTAGIPLLRGDNVVQGRFRWDDVKRWPPSEVEGLSDYFLQSGDVVLAMDRPWIEAGLKYAAVSEHDLPCLLVQRVARLRARASLDQGFLRYIVGSADFTDHILAVQTGTAVPHISSNQIKEFRFIRPPHPEQRAIARVLGALDDKISLNGRMNVTLEAMARSLYKAWFVDFEPVLARAEGGQLIGLDAETAGLFPDGCDESELGRAPAGWDVGHLSDIIELIGGGTPKTTVSEYWNGDIPWFSVADAPADSDIFVLTTQKTITQAGLQNSSARLLLPRTTIISARGTVGKCALVANPMAMNQSCYGVRGRDGRGDYYTYFTVRQSVADLQRGSHGSVFDTITRSTFDSLSLVIPPIQLTQAYDRMISPWTERVLANLRESHALAAVRDTLLPMLLSGEVSVTEAEQLVEAAV